MRLPLLVVFVGLASCCLGFYLGRGTRAELRAERNAALAGASQSAGPQVPQVCVASIDPETLRRELARALHGEGAPAAEQAAEAAPKANEPPPPPTPEQTAALEKAQEAVDRTIARGILTSADAEELRMLIHRTDGDTQFQLATRLAAAMNHDQLKVEPHAVPF